MHKVINNLSHILNFCPIIDLAVIKLTSIKKNSYFCKDDKIYSGIYET